MVVSTGYSLLLLLSYYCYYAQKFIFTLLSYKETVQYVLVIVIRIGRNIPPVAADSIMTCIAVSLFAMQNGGGSLRIHYKPVGVVQMTC